MEKKKWRYFLYIVNAYSIGFVSILLILSLRALMQSYPEPVQNLLYYMGEFIFSPFGIILALCIAWDSGCFLLWLSKKDRKTKKGAALWLQVCTHRMRPVKASCFSWSSAYGPVFH